MSMKKNKWLIIILFIIIVILILFLCNKKTEKIYSKPIISKVNYIENEIEVNAGMYKYGDIDLNGIINEYDLENIDLIINKKLSYREEQLLLADINNDKIINEKDYEILQEAIKKPNSYNPNTKEMLYCLTETQDSNNCKWQNNKEFVLPEKNKEYYVYVKINNDNISNDYKVSYNDEYIETGDISDLEE